MNGVFISARDLTVRFPLPGGASVLALDHICLDIRKGEILALVGESGCGKSTFARSLVRLIRPSSGEILLPLDGNNDLARLKDRELLPWRRRTQLIFQDPAAALDPRLTVGESIAEPLVFFRLAERAALGRRVAELLRLVEMDPALAARYPHQLSGGQRQRIAIARALGPEPDFLIADEPLSQLDVCTQSQVAWSLLDLQRRLGFTLLLIAHDLRMVRAVADRVARMHAGCIIELAQNVRGSQAAAVLPEQPERSILTDFSF